MKRVAEITEKNVNKFNISGKNLIIFKKRNAKINKVGCRGWGGYQGEHSEYKFRTQKDS